MSFYYDIQVLDYGSEIEVKKLPSPVPLPGVVSRFSRPEARFYNDEVVPFLDDDGCQIVAHDMQEVASREKESARRSLNRSRQVIYSLARGYSWDYFLTFTFAASHVDRYNYDDCSALMSRWLNNMRHQSPDMRYIIVPELHKDGAFHFHGLIADCPSLRLRRHNRKIFNVLSFPYGFSTASRVNSPERASNYISKYITKELVAVSKGKKRYWHSRNIHVPDPDRLSMPYDEKEDFLSAVRRRASYVSSVITQVGELIYFHLKKEDFEDVAVVHSIENYISRFAPPLLGFY